MKFLTMITVMIPLMATANSEIDQVLKIKNQRAKQNTNGLDVGRIDKKSIQDAVDKLGGVATVEFSSNERMQVKSSTIAQRGGVIIGSGADGNTPPGKSNQRGVTVAPPTPKNSITVTARPGYVNKNHRVCALLKGHSWDEVCVKFGQAMRLIPGTYLIMTAFMNDKKELDFYEDKQIILDTFAAVKVTLHAGENIIIPAREIRIPKSEELSSYYIRRNKSYPSGAKLESLVKEFEFNPRGKEYTPLIAHHKYTSGPTDSFAVVLPGIYDILWDFDGQADVTRGIVID